MKNLKNNIALTVAFMPLFIFAQTNSKQTLQETVFVSSDDKTITLKFNEVGNYVIYQGRSVGSIDWNSPVNVKNTAVYTAEKKSLRPFYAVVNHKKDTVMVAERKIPFQKTANFRDLGGIETQDGRFVQWGKFYRSDAMASFTSEELERYAALNVAKVFDMRSTNEVQQAPNMLPTGVQNIHMPVFDEMQSSMFAGIEEKMKNGTLTEKDAAELLMVGNKQFASEYAAKFKGILQQMLATEEPVVFHCSAGKDRTGFMSAMILSALNVDRETIYDEYEMTNFYTKDKIKGMMEQAEKGKSMFPGMDTKALAKLMTVDREFLKAAFDIIDSQFGGIDQYLKNQMGISDQDRKKLIDTYTYR